MYTSLCFRNIAIFSIISTVLIFIVSYIFCFCDIIFGSRINLNHAIDPTDIDKQYLFRIHCYIVLVETFPVCQVGGWIYWNHKKISPTLNETGAELGSKCCLNAWLDAIRVFEPYPALKIGHWSPMKSKTRRRPEIQVKIMC